MHNPLPRWVIRAGLGRGRSPIHVRSTPDSDRKFKAPIRRDVLIRDHLHCKKNSNFFRRQAPMKAATGCQSGRDILRGIVEGTIRLGAG
jgi:hypothetical protein